MITQAFTVKTTQATITTWAKDADTAINMVLEAEGAPFEALVAVYQDNPVPNVSGEYGAPMGRHGSPLDFDTIPVWRADRVEIDEGGYDAGGAYWGLRPSGQSLYAVQDGVGNIAFVDATSEAKALEIAQED